MLTGGVWHEPARLLMNEPGTRGPWHPGRPAVSHPRSPRPARRTLESPPDQPSSGKCWRRRQRLGPGSTILQASPDAQRIMAHPLLALPSGAPPTPPPHTRSQVATWRILRAPPAPRLPSWETPALTWGKAQTTLQEFVTTQQYFKCQIGQCQFTLQK